MVPGAEPRGYGLTASDMEASRLVFVSVKGSQQRRKAAVPVPDGYTWAQFCDQVKLKLKLNNIKAIYLASSGEKIASLDGLEDIDDLFVEEGLASPTNGMNSTSPLATEAALREGETSTSEFQYAASAGAQQPVTVHRAQAGDSGRNHALLDGNVDSAPSGVDDEQKYLKRSNVLKRFAQRIFPDAFVPSLPLTTRQSTGEDSRGRRRRKRGAITRNNLVLLTGMAFTLLTMYLLYWRMSTARR